MRRTRSFLAIVGVCVAAVLAGPGGATAQISQTFDFPSSDSTVVGSVGFFDADEVGAFWSMQRGDRVSETFTFSGPSSINRALLQVAVVTNVLAPGQSVNWNLEINGTVLGSFTVPAGFTGPLTLDVSFPPISGPTYAVTIRVTNEVPGGGGAHTLAYAGNLAHSIELFATLATTKAQCKKGGWRDFGVFKNQGDCVSFVATGGKNPPSGTQSASVGVPRGKGVARGR
jgi:hypothetical protein